MPASTADGPAVALSFANNFWGKDDAGVTPMLTRMASAKTTCDELRAFYGARATIEEEYARKLANLCRKPLGSQESGTLKISLDTVRGEVEQMAKQHQNISAQMKTELEEPLAAFAGAMKERRKIIQNTVEKLLKVKTQQTQHVNKTRDKYEQECLKIKGYLAQGHMVMGQEERRNKAKLEKTQISLATSNTEYENAVKALEDTTMRWNREWKAAADKFQDLEEERLDFTKSSLWTFANIASTVCVSDDSSCEKIRLSLETMDVEQDIVTFINEKGTGQEIPDPPKYINFCRGDVNDSQSEASEDDNYSVAQFPRNINPAFRSSSPQPSTFESHHDPNSALAQDLAHRDLNAVAPKPSGALQNAIPQPSDELIMQPPRSQPRHQPIPQQLAPQLTHHMHQQMQPRGSLDMRPHEQMQPRGSLDMRLQDQMQSRGALDMRPREQMQPRGSLDMRPQDQMQHRGALDIRPPEQVQSRGALDMRPQEQMHSRGALDMRPKEQMQSRGVLDMRSQEQVQSRGSLDMRPQEPRQPDMRQGDRPSLDMRRQQEDQFRRQPPTGHVGYDVNQHGPVAAVPHDPYPMDGMTMLCRTSTAGPPSDRSSQVTSARPSSRDSHSEYSNPTSLSSMEPPSGKTSPVKQDPSPAPSPVKLVAKKKSSNFLKNHSPFRRKSNKELQPANRNTWHAPSPQTSSSPTRRPQVQNQEAPVVTAERTQSPEPIDANASLALGVGQNVFSVSNPDSKQEKQDSAKEEEEMDPIALALAELKGVTLGKQSSVRMSADHYHGISTPKPGSETSSASRSVPVPGSKDAAAVKRGTPPPSYQNPTSRLGVPPPAVTSKAMKEATKKATTQTRSLFGDHTRSESAPQNIPTSISRPGTRTSNAGRGDTGSYSGSPSPRPATRNTNIGRGESGSYSSASVSRPPTRGSEMGRTEAAGYSTPPVTRSGTRATEASRMDTGSYSAHPLSRPGTRGTDMSRGGSGVYGSSPVSRPGTRGSDMPRAASPAPTRSASPQPPMNDSSRMSYRSVSPNPYAASQRSPSVMSTPRNRGSDAGYYQQSSPGPASRGPSPSPYKEYNRPQSSYSNNGMAVQLAPVNDPYGSQRSRDSRPSSRAAGYQEGGSVADPSRLYTRDGRPILHYARAMYMYQAAIPEELGFNKGDYLAILRHQDDGWWEAEVHDGNGHIGLVPSNYLQAC